MELGTYISDKIKQFEQTHNCYGYLVNATDRYLKDRWKDEKKRDDEKWAAVNCNQDVVDLIIRFDNTVAFVEEHVKQGHIEDAFNMQLSLYNAMLGLSKMGRCIDRQSDRTSFEQIPTEEIDKWFDRLESIFTRMNAQNLRRMM